MARQHLGQEEGKGPSAAATLAAIGAKDPLAAQGLAAYGGRVIAVKLAMAVQALSAAAVRTPLLLEQKRSSSSCLGLPTKRQVGLAIRCCCQNQPLRSSPFGRHCRHCRRRNSLVWDQEEGGGGGTGRHFTRFAIVIPPQTTTLYRHKNGTFYDGTTGRNSLSALPSSIAAELPRWGRSLTIAGVYGILARAQRSSGGRPVPTGP